MGDNYSNGTTSDTLESLKAERADLEKTIVRVQQMARDFDAETERRKSFDAKRVAFHPQLKNPDLRRCVWKGFTTPKDFQWFKPAIARKKALAEQALKDAAVVCEALVGWAKDLEKREKDCQARGEQQTARDSGRPPLTDTSIVVNPTVQALGQVAATYTGQALSGIAYLAGAADDTVTFIDENLGGNEIFGSGGIRDFFNSFGANPEAILGDVAGTAKTLVTMSRGAEKTEETGPVLAEIAKTGQSITRERILSRLKGLTEQSDAISSSISSKASGLNVLGDNLFARTYALKGGLGEAPQAFAYGEQIFVRRGSANLLSDVVHEGTHSLDYLSGFDGSTLQLELRAYSAEGAFQQAGGGTVEFSSDQEMLDFIQQHY
jgi:hypothetical protein